MKIIFLDHQGVMHLKKYNAGGLMNNSFDPDALKILNFILSSDVDIEIVVSSDWKLWIPLAEMQTFYKSQGILKAPIDYTRKTEKYDRRIYGEQRSVEIKDWLRDTKFNITHWVSIDDLDMRTHLENFVWISDPTIGLKQDGIKEQIMSFFS